VFSDNAAGRLHVLVTAFRRHASNQTIPQAWAAALGMSDIGSPVLLSRLAYVFRLPEEIEHEIAMVDVQEYDNDLALRWRMMISGRLGPALFSGGQAGQIATAMDDASLNSLEYCSYVLHRHRPQRVFSDSELDRIRGLTQELGEAVDADSDMDQSLRDFMLSHVNAMIRALSEVDLRGPVALEDALDRAVGAVRRRVDLVVRMESNPTAWSKFQNLIVGVAAVLQIATAGLALPGQVRQELEGPAPSPAPVIQVREIQPPGLTVPPVQIVQNGAERS